MLGVSRNERGFVIRFATIHPLLGAALVLLPVQARAEAPPAPASTSALKDDSGGAAVPSRKALAPSRGFQVAFRSGVLVPMGNATAAPSDSLGSRYAWQVPIVVDLGAKIIDPLFVGAYLGAGFGSTGSHSELEAVCDDDDEDFENDISCSAYTLRAGLEAIYGFQPGERVNPWIGYGFGIEAAHATLTDDQRGYSETVSMRGFTYAQLSAGLDSSTFERRRRAFHRRGHRPIHHVEHGGPRRAHVRRLGRRPSAARLDISGSQNRGEPVKTAAWGACVLALGCSSSAGGPEYAALGLQASDMLGRTTDRACFELPVMPGGRLAQDVRMGDAFVAHLAGTRDGIEVTLSDVVNAEDARRNFTHDELVAGTSETLTVEATNGDSYTLMLMSPCSEQSR